MRRFILPPVVILCLLALSSLSPGSGARALSVQTATITPIPGGTWINPGNQFVVTGTTLHFAVHAYPTNSGDPKIDHVNFTATWPGAAWRVACAVSNHRATMCLSVIGTSLKQGCRMVAAARLL